MEWSLQTSNNVFNSIDRIGAYVNLTIFIMVVFGVFVISRLLGLNVLTLVRNVLFLGVRLVNRVVRGREQAYQRDLAIGKVNQKRMRYKSYRFLSDLIIDLELRDMKPYELLCVVLFISFAVAFVICKGVFNNLLLFFPLFPIVLALFMCSLYTRSNIAHDERIDAVIKAQNIISNNIKGGVIVSIKSSLDLLPKSVKGDFAELVENVEYKNQHIRVALRHLNNRLGSMSDDFIKKCIVFEMKEERGLEGMFKDIVEINNVKTEMRNNAKRAFEEVKSAFIAGALIIFMFLGGVIAVYENVRLFYFKHPVGQIILCIDMLFMVCEFVYITYLRAKEL